MKKMETTGTRLRIMATKPKLGRVREVHLVTRTADARSVPATALLDGGVALVLVVALELEVACVIAWTRLESVVAEGCQPRSAVTACEPT